MPQQSPAPGRNNASPRVLRIFIIALLSIAVASITVGAAAKLVSLDAEADIGVTKSAPDNALADTDLTYSISVFSVGPDTTSATLNDTLPAGTTFVSMASPAGWSCSTPAVGGTGTVSCTNANFGVSAGDAFTMVVHIDSGAAMGTFISNTATVSSSLIDNNDENNSSTASTLITGETADLGISKSASTDTVPADRDITYTITVNNVGPNASANAAWTDTLPGNMTFVSLASPAGWSCTTPAVASGGTINCSNSSLAVNAGAQVFTLVGHIPSGTADGTEYANRAAVTSTTSDPNPENAESIASILVGCVSSPLVSVTSDSGAGSLREAIANACNGSTILFAQALTAGGPATITLTSAELLINKNLTIQGPGANLLTVRRSTAGGTPNFRIVEIAGSSNVNISGLTISNGNLNGAVIPGADVDKNAAVRTNIIAVNPGGGILNAGTLVLNGVAVDRNSADRAGGISNSGTLTLVKSTVSGNISVNFGAGVVNSSGMTIIDSTLSGNSTAGQGGGIYNDTGGTLSIINATITNNRSDSDNSGAEQGGGIFRNAGTVTLQNTIAVGNFRGTGSTRDDISGAVDGASSFNLVSDGTNLTGMSNASNGNQIGSAGSPLNALLGPLAFNGGATQTHLPLPTSPVINSGSNANLPADTLDLDNDGNTAEALPVDQRGTGFARVVGATVDIGALETSYLVTATAGTPQSTNVNSAFATALKATVSESGNPQSNLDVTFAAPSSGASGTFAGPSITAVVSTNGSGVATAPTFTANSIGGSYNVIASIGSAIPTVNFALTNNKLNQTIAFAAISSKTTLDPDFVVSPTASSGLAVALSASGQCSVTTPAPGTVHITGAGNCTITASQAGNATYNAASNVGQSFTISKVNQTITFAAVAARTFGDPDFVISPTASSGLAVSLAATGNCSVTTPSPGTVHITGAGNCTITATQAGDATYSAAPDLSQSFSINKAAIGGAFTSSLNPSNVGQSVTFTFTVTSSDGTPTGTVQFKDGGVNIGSPQVVNGSGVVTISTTSLLPGVHVIDADYSGDTNFHRVIVSLFPNQQVGSIVRFSSANYNTTEGAGFITITIERIGDLSQAVAVDYATPDDSSAATVLPCSNTGGVAAPRCDFEPSFGTIRFAAGDGAAKTFLVLINQDNFVEGPESLTLTLSNLTGGAGFTTPGDTTATATLTITDDVTEPAGNPIDDTDTFVRQQYRDFLNREPDPAGLAFWKDNIDKCNDPARRPAGLSVSQCIEVQRINTSAAFFVSIEFQNTGYFVERVYKAAFADINPPTVPVPVRFSGFFTDTPQIGAGVIVGQGNWQQQLDNNKAAYALSFVQRTAFLNRYPASTSATAFVDSLNTNAGSVLTNGERSALIAELAPSPSDPALRASVLKKVADNALLQQGEFNRAFVLLQYFGYLRRNPDAAPEPGLNFAGYNFWLNKLNQFNGNYVEAEMVKAFLSSTEYRQRFGQ